MDLNLTSLPLPENIVLCIRWNSLERKIVSISIVYFFWPYVWKKKTMDILNSVFTGFTWKLLFCENSGNSTWAQNKTFCLFYLVKIYVAFLFLWFHNNNHSNNNNNNNNKKKKKNNNNNNNSNNNDLSQH